MIRESWNPKSEIVMAAIVQGLERQIVVLDVVGSIPTSRPIYLPPFPSFCYCISTAGTL